MRRNAISLVWINISEAALLFVYSLFQKYREQNGISILEKKVEKRQDFAASSAKNIDYAV